MIERDDPPSPQQLRDEDIASALPKNLDEVPRLRGFRLRGMEMTRLETFIDAAFAFAITLLVIASGPVPDNIGTLLAAFKNVPAFLASIAVLARFWRGHWLWSRRYGLEDGVSVVISWAMLVTILIFVYPLKMLFGAMFYYVSGHRLGQVIEGDAPWQARALFAVYAVGTAAIALEIVLLNVRAWQLREPLRLNERERMLTRAEIAGWCVPVGVGLLSLVLALTLPMRALAWSGWCYCLLFILIPLSGRRVRRKLIGMDTKK